MSLFYNNYQRLVQENNDAIAKISGESWSTLCKMFEYMRFYNISLFELEVLKKDLLGAAREADMEGIDFRDKLGMPEKEFCDSLVRDGIEHIWQERIVLAVRNVVLIIFAYYTFMWLLDGMPMDYGIRTEALFFGTVGAFLNYITNHGIRGFGAYRLSDKGKRRASIGVFIVWGIAITAVIMKAGFIIRGNGAVIFLILFVLSAATFFGNNIYWNKRSEKYDWK